jgi:hypothetical protein
MTVRARLMTSAAILLVAVAVCGVTPSGAFAASAWWHLTSGSRPGHLQAGVATNEVQDLTVSATKGDVLLANSEALQHGELLMAIVPYNAKPELVQEELENNVYPSRKVEVTGGPGDEEGTKSYVITFPGQSVEPVFANGEVAEFFGGEKLSCEGATGSGCTHEASVTELSKGRPDGQIYVTAANLGDASTSGEVRVIAGVPPGLEAVSVHGLAGDGVEVGLPGNDGPVACTLGSQSMCSFNGSLRPYHQIEVSVGVVVKGAHSGEPTQGSVSGGGLPGASTAGQITVSDEPTPFGVSEYAIAPEEEGGTTDRQAGSHPFQLTTTLTLNQAIEYTRHEGELPTPAQLPKDLRFNLPPGLIGNPTVFPRCTVKDFETKVNTNTGQNGCGAQTALGVARITISEQKFVGLETFVAPLFNLEPAVGEPARFGFFAHGNPVILDTSVRTGGDYGVTVSVPNIIQTAGFMKSEVTFWGVPGDPRHDSARGWGCIFEGLNVPANERPACNPSESKSPPPFLSLPTSCSGPLQSSVEADSWRERNIVLSSQLGEAIPALGGCNRLPFSSSISVAPDTQAASTPTGLTVGIHVPQEEALNGSGLAPAQVKDTTVVLPAGVALNPAAADGLQACSDMPEAGRSEGQFGLHEDAKSACPEASKVGTVEIKTPLLPNPLVGAAYLAAQTQNPFGSLVALYVEAEDPISGSLVKLAGEVKPDPATGQLVSTFLNTPQLPFEDFKLHFFGGSRAPLGTPAACGSYTTTASIQPWSGNLPAESSSTFGIDSGPDGSPCASPLPFNPELAAGSLNIQAGAFTPFTTTMSRADGQQNLQGIQLHMPPGLSGLLSGVKLCGEAEANAGTCGPESLIGETTVSVGLGGNPFSVKGGRVYITGPHDGAPFGLSIVNPAKAGPYDLEQGTSCDCVVVRAKIEVDPDTAQLTITTDSSGPYRIPTIIQGIPLQIQHVNVVINREHFTFNPTNCNKQTITGSLQSTEGASSALSVPFQVTNCATLKFAPKFQVAVTGKTSKASGAGLSVKLSYPPGSLGTEANVGRVKVELPIQLPSRLTTLQQACLAATFDANPVSCPPASIVGHAKVITPLLPVPLEGPAYFVSHGAEKFPDLTIVLRGYGVTIQLVGTTFISKRGITSTTFKTPPDTPFNTFELTLPQGKFSALAANVNLCSATKLVTVKKRVTVRKHGRTTHPIRNVKQRAPQTLLMPTEFTGQNGAQVTQSTKIAVTGCPKAKKTKNHAKSKGKRKKG